MHANKQVVSEHQKDTHLNSHIPSAEYVSCSIYEQEPRQEQEQEPGQEQEQEEPGQEQEEPGHVSR